MSKVLTVKNISKKFDGKLALDDISFELEPGRIVGLIGPNGSGKTTLIKTITQIFRPDTGEITICGEPTGYKTKQYVSYMPDQNHLFHWMTIRDAIHYYQDMFTDFSISSAKEICSFLNLNEKERIKILSNGTIERVQIMLTFSRKTTLYVLDEPFAGIDPLGRDKILKTILAGVNENSAVIISTHLVKDVETVLDDVIMLNQGRILLTDTTDKIRGQNGTSIEECYLEMYKNAKAD